MYVPVEYRCSSFMSALRLHAFLSLLQPREVALGEGHVAAARRGAPLRQGGERRQGPQHLPAGAEEHQARHGGRQAAARHPNAHGRQNALLQGTETCEMHLTTTSFTLQDTYIHIYINHMNMRCHREYRPGISLLTSAYDTSSERRHSTLAAAALALLLSSRCSLSPFREAKSFGVAASGGSSGSSEGPGASWKSCSTCQASSSLITARPSQHALSAGR